MENILLRLAERVPALLLWAGCSVSGHEAHLVCGVVQVLIPFVDFLSSCSVHYWKQESGICSDCFRISWHSTAAFHVLLVTPIKTGTRPCRTASQSGRNNAAGVFEGVQVNFQTQKLTRFPSLSGCSPLGTCTCSVQHFKNDSGSDSSATIVFLEFLLSFGFHHFGEML